MSAEAVRRATVRLVRVRDAAVARDEAWRAYDDAMRVYEGACRRALEGGWSVREIADTAGVTRQAVYKLLRG